MNTPASAGLWENVPLIGYTQYPWRMLGLASLLLALMTAVSVPLLLSSLSAAPARSALVGVLSALMLVYALPWTFTAYVDVDEPRGIRDVQEFERESGQLALSSFSEYLPVSADASQLSAEGLV